MKLELCRRHVQVLAAAPVLPAVAVALALLPVVLRDPPLRSDTSGISEQCVKALANFAVIKIFFFSKNLKIAIFFSKNASVITKL